jgi:cell division protease FtsH
MDGFTGTEGVVVLAATNRPDVLDAALLRPGRFDRRVTVSPPDLTGRRQILAVHTRGVAVAPDVDLDAVAASTPGMVGADLANLVNEAALLAARRGHDQVGTADFADALEKIVLGSVRGIMLSREERERTANHESGHALLGIRQRRLSRGSGRGQLLVQGVDEPSDGVIDHPSVEIPTATSRARRPG